VEVSQMLIGAGASVHATDKWVRRHALSDGSVQDMEEKRERDRRIEHTEIDRRERNRQRGTKVD